MIFTIDEQIRKAGRPRSNLTEDEKKARNALYMKQYYEQHRDQMANNARRTYLKNREIIKNHTGAIKT